MENDTEAPYFIPIMWQANTSHASPHYSQRANLYGVGGIPHSQWGGIYEIIGGGGSTMYQVYRNRYNLMVVWDAPLEIELILDPAYDSITADVTVTGEITEIDNKIVFILTNYQNSDYFCSATSYDEYDFTLTEIGESQIFTHAIEPGAYDLDNLTMNVFVQSFEGYYRILQANRVNITEMMTPVYEDAIEFGSIMVGETHAEVLPVYNYSDDELSCMMFPPQGFSAPANFIVSAHTMQEIEIGFEPQQAMTYSDILIMTTNLPDYSTIFIDLSGTGLPSNNSDPQSNISNISSIGNYPNPFNPETAICYELKKADHVKLDIYNIKGERITELVNQNQSAGKHQIIWQNNDLAAGVYFVKLVSGNYITEHKLILLK